MASAIPLTRADMKRLADYAKREGVKAEVQIDDFIFRVSADHPPAKVDGSEESELDRELMEFDRKHGYR
ncbi:hypothetical protein [Shinella pollutisoli]|uniref:Uncharacterized protein n=1 Tax=Shinella pollutisoli TaxID=2250594 RepID=A0ABV7DB74_9HYPH|nr:hypothetical protein [Shinella pollutisoli]